MSDLSIFGPWRWPANALAPLKAAARIVAADALGPKRQRIRHGAAGLARAASTRRRREVFSSPLPRRRGRGG